MYMCGWPGLEQVSCCACMCSICGSHLHLYYTPIPIPIPQGVCGLDRMLVKGRLVFRWSLSAPVLCHPTRGGRR